MLSIHDEHVFNDDLLTGERDREKAKRAFPNIYFALDHPELRAMFDPLDAEANREKLLGRYAGFIAIMLALASLLLVAAEPVIHYNLHIDTEAWLGPLAAFTGLAGLVVGVWFGLHSGAKRKWLLKRFVCERLRELQFQILIFRAPMIVDAIGDPAKQEAFFAERQRLRDAFAIRHEARIDAEFADITESEGDQACWLASAPDEAAVAAMDPAKADELFRAYEHLRINHQIGYVTHKLRNSTKLFDFPIRRQEGVFAVGTIILVGLLFSVHLLTLPGAIFDFNSNWDRFFHFLTIAFAVTALAIRALEEGFQPQRDVERYETYRYGCRVVRERFGEAKTPAEKFEAMRQFERLVFEEMKLFMRTSARSRFVL
ncbi:MAG: hypothetical protein AB7J28_02385 [Hyphomonadaceae bacterium]